MIEIIKELLEKPENLRAYLISIFKIILSIIVSSKLYILIYGNYDPILIGDKYFWLDFFQFIIKGRILIVLGIFFFVRLVLLDLVSTISFLILTKLTKPITIKSNPLEDDTFFRYIFNLLGILNFDKARIKMPLPGRNFHQALEIVNEVDKNDLSYAITELKNTTIFEVFNIFVIFSTVYFFFLPNFHHQFINVLIGIVFIGFILFLISIEYIFSVLESTYEKFSLSLNLINQIKITEDFILTNGLYTPSKNELIKDIPLIKEIIVKDTLYYICHFIEGRRMYKILKNLENEKGRIILITQTKIPKGMLQHFEDDYFKIIKFKNKDNFIKKLGNYLFQN